MASHEEYMLYCVQLAKRAGKLTQSNPNVGSILVHQENIIGEGFHELYGKNHAERNAINEALKKNPALISQATLYVTLEPCFHQGKTPPCVHLILEHKIKKVVVGCQDPNPIVAGKSIKLLNEKGVETIIGVAEKQCNFLISKFKANLKKRPYIILKWAQSYDGFMGKPDMQIWISNKFSKILVHRWRAEVDGIMVGTQTIINDNPALTTREWEGENPIRIIPDFNNRLNASHQILNDGLSTIILNTKKNKKEGSVEYISLSSKTIHEYWGALFNRQIYSVLVEGGKQLLESILKSGLWDEARIITNNKFLYTGIKSPTVIGKLYHKQSISDDNITTILKEDS